MTFKNFFSWVLGATALGALLASPSVLAQPVTGSAKKLDVRLNDELIAIAERVQTGRIACELGAFVEVVADAKHPGFFDLHGKGFHYHMAPVVSKTGAIRLEDTVAGAFWIQLNHKSMLLNQKLGQRMADECVSPQQAMAAEAMRHESPRHLFE
jgi:hypothetical protein